MNDISTMTVDEQKQLEKLIVDAERNKSDAQRLALDAGKLLTITSDRLNDYKDRGFFKRCWYKISGKQGSLDRANQSDLISMQKFAWAYLVKLQEQNILEAQAIAVIRNNLKDIQAEVSEIHDMISEIVQKFDARIKKLEENSALNDWRNHIEASSSRFDTSDKQLCFLELVFDCLRVVRENSIKFGCVRVDEYFYNAMKDVGLNRDAEYTVDEFISGLYEDVCRVGFEKYHRMIALNVSGNIVDSEYILENVTGAGYNAIYQFDVEMAKMQSMAKHLSPDVAKDAMLRTIRASINNGATRYSVKELAMEIIGGSLVAEEVYLEENGCEKLETSEAAAIGEGFSIDSLLGNYVAISNHAFLDTLPSDEEKRIYLESFALVFATIGGYKESHYLTSIAKLFESEDALNRVELLTINPKKISVPDIMKVLSSDDRKYAWCVDAMFIGEEDGNANAKVRNAVLSMCKVFGFKENEISPFVEKIESLATGSDPKSLFDAIRGINQRTQAWRSVVDFKRISLKGAFDDLRNRMSAKSMEAVQLSLKITRVSMDMAMSSCTFAMGDENFLQRSAINIERTSYISKFKDLKKEVESFESSASPILAEANSILVLFKTDTIHPSGSLYSIEADEASGVGNENWGDNMNSAFEKLSDYVSAISSAFDRLDSQIKLYEQGKYSESAEANAKKARELAAAKKAADKEAKKAAKIEKGGLCAVVKMNFTKVDNLPFDFSKAKNCIWFNGQWILLVDDVCWSSEDCLSWSKMSIPTELHYNSRIKVENDTAIIWSESEDEFIFSTDGMNWVKGKFPENYYNKEVFHYRGRWMLQHMKYKDYTYMKEGLIWDSEEKGTCDATEWYFSDELSGEWTKDPSMSFSTGYYVPDGCACVAGDELLAVKAISSSFASDKHITNTDSKLYYYNGSEWKSASFKGAMEGSLFPSAKFLKIKDGVLFSLNDRGIWLSLDNHNWEKVSEDGPGYGFHMIGNLSCALGYGEHGPTAYVSVDGKDFVPIVLEHRPSVIAFHGDSAVCVDTDNNGGGLFVVKVAVE